MEYAHEYTVACPCCNEDTVVRVTESRSPITIHEDPLDIEVIHGNCQCCRDTSEITTLKREARAIYNEEASLGRN